jgi:hypothetical protein
MSATVFEEWEMRCPQCDRDDHIDVCVNVWVRLCPDGTYIDAADHEWDQDSLALCARCSFSGSVRDFQITDETPTQTQETKP